MGKKKGPNEKAVAAAERKATAKQEKDRKQAQLKEDEDAKHWSVGAKDRSKHEEAERKKQEALAKKKEREALLALEEQQLPSKPKVKEPKPPRKPPAPAEYAATGLDAALELMTVAVNGDGPADKVDRHPERRMKSAYAAFEERELPILKAENPSLRLSQLKELLHKKWLKSPDNPMNQAHVKYDAKSSEIQELVQSKKEDVLETYRV